MNSRILLSSPDTGPAEEEAVLRALRSGWVAPLGPEVDAFEQEIAEYTQRKHAVALSSGTAALHLALLNWGIGPGDLVLTATMTFAATANAITYTGAEPVFVDCDAIGNIDVVLLQHALDDLQSQGKSVAAILPVDLLGKVADYESIQQIADRAGVPVLADSAESLGAWRNGQPAGSFGDAAILSFNGNKVMTTSGGGMLLTDDADFAERARYLATQARQPVIHYEHIDIGYNYRLSNILAAIGRAELGRLDEMIERRRKHRLRYRDLLANTATPSRPRPPTAPRRLAPNVATSTCTRSSTDSPAWPTPRRCLVLQAAAVGHDAEVMVLDMGEPAKIQEIATTLIDLSGSKGIEIVYTGLRPGEKMSEELFTPGEDIQATAPELVNSVGVPPMDSDAVAVLRNPSPAASAEWMRNVSVSAPQSKVYSQ